MSNWFTCSRTRILEKQKCLQMSQVFSYQHINLIVSGFYFSRILKRGRFAQPALLPARPYYPCKRTCDLLIWQKPFVEVLRVGRLKCRLFLNIDKPCKFGDGDAEKPGNRPYIQPAAFRIVQAVR